MLEKWGLIVTVLIHNTFKNNVCLIGEWDRLVKIMEVWIVSQAGLTLLHVQNPKVEIKQSVDPILFAGLITAVENMASSSLNSIKMQDSKLLMIPVSTDEIRFTLICRAKSSDKDKNLRKMLDRVIGQFIQDFREILPTWNGDQTIFHYFQAVVQENCF